jgi:tRNA G10  N-methylase Trm11
MLQAEVMSNTTHQREHALHTIMSRTGSFPLRVALDLISRYAGKGAIVLDPFCGKGTVPFAARILGGRAFGSDIAPEAVICSRAKLLECRLDYLLDYVERLQLPTDITGEDVPQGVQIFYHPETLAELLRLRKVLLADLEVQGLSGNALMTLALVLGILHGHAKYSLSLPCAHAYSMAPGYVSQYCAARQVIAPQRDVKRCIVEKAKRCLIGELPSAPESSVLQASALKVAENFPELVGKVDLVLTSPPYLNAQTYAKDNWLRQWFLGYDYKLIQRCYIETASINCYVSIMRVVIENLTGMLRQGGYLVMIAGDVRLRKRKSSGTTSEVIDTAELLGQVIRESNLGLSIEECYPQRVRSRTRYFHALSKTNGHSKRDLMERVLVARKV